MEYKLIYLKEIGKLRFGGKNISHYNKYDDPKDIPLFFSDQTPVTAGLKLMENNGSVIIADADKVEEIIADLGDEKVEKEILKRQPMMEKKSPTITKKKKQKTKKSKALLKKA